MKRHRQWKWKHKKEKKADQWFSYERKKKTDQRSYKGKRNEDSI